jgi:hypothetical protein
MWSPYRFTLQKKKSWICIFFVELLPHVLQRAILSDASAAPNFLEIDPSIQQLKSGTYEQYREFVSILYLFNEVKLTYEDLLVLNLRMQGEGSGEVDNVNLFTVDMYGALKQV